MGKFKKIKNKVVKFIKRNKKLLNTAVFIIFTFIPTYFWYQEKLQSDAFEAYITAKNYYSTKQYSLALPFYEKTYKLEPEIPNLSYEYGRTCFKLENYSKALAIWENVPKGEIHEYYEYDKARSYHNLIRFQKTNEKKKLYEKLARENYKIATETFKGTTNITYWYSRYYLLIFRSDKLNANLLKEEIDDFAINTKSLIDNKLNLYPGADFSLFSKREKDLASINILSYPMICKLYLILAQKSREEKQYYLAYESILKAFEYQKTPSGEIKSEDLECALKGLSKIIAYDIKEFKSKFNLDGLEKILTEVFYSNKDFENSNIHNICAVLLNIYFNKKIELYNKNIKEELNLISKFTINDKNGIIKIIINSSIFNLDNKSIYLDNKNKFDFNLSRSIFDIKKYDLVRIHIENLIGNSKEYLILPFFENCNKM